MIGSLNCFLFCSEMILAGITFIFLLLIAKGNGHSVDSLIGELIVDVTTSLYASSSLRFFTCADEDNLIEFSRMMSSHHKMHEISRIQPDLRVNNLDFTETDWQHRHFHVVDLDCPGSYDLLDNVNDKDGFVAPAKWLFLQDRRFLSEYDEKSLKNKFGNFNLFADSEITIGQRIENNVFILLSIYRPSPVRDLIVEQRGRWIIEKGIQLFDNRVSSRRRLNLHLTPLKASIVATEPDAVNHLDEATKGDGDIITKVGYRFSKLLAARMNATLSFTSTNTWGYRDKNGSWSGMTGALDRREADFGGTTIFITKERVGVIEYIHLTTPNRVRFVFKRPPLSHVANLFTLPFTATVWIACIVLCCLVFSLLYMTMIMEWNNLKDIPHEERLSGDLEIKPAFGDNFLILFGAITQQGSAYEPRSVSARIVILMVLLFCFNLYVAYTANIVALLQSSSDSIKTVADLMNSHLKIGIQDIVYSRYYFPAFEDKERKDFYETRVKNQKNIWMQLSDGVKRLRNESFAFHCELTPAYTVVQKIYGEDEKCDFEEIDFLNVPDPTFAITRRSPYREFFRVGALWFEEVGIKQRFVRLLYEKRPPCNNLKKFFHVSTIECYAAYLTMGYGMALSLIIWIIEVILSRSFRQGDDEVDDMSESNTID